jgi:hypothetical protein
MRAFAPKIKPMTQQIEAASRATQTLVGGTVARAAPQSPNSFAFTAWDVVANAPKVLASILTVALLVFFFLVYGDEILRRAVEISPTFSYKRHTVSIVRSIQEEVSSYLLMTASINVTLGLVTAGMGVTIFCGAPRFCGGKAIVSRPIVTEPPVIVETHLAWRRASMTPAMHRFIETSQTVGKAYRVM